MEDRLPMQEVLEMSDRPSKRIKNTDADADTKAIDELSLTLQDTLGFGSGTAEEEGNGGVNNDGEPCNLLAMVLSHLCSSTDLIRTRQVCRPFHRCSDKIAIARTQLLIGKHIKPMVGQTMLGLLHGAEEANELTRRRLREWDAKTGRAEGFDVGLPTKKPAGAKWHLMATVRYGNHVPEAYLPFNVQLSSVVMTLEGDRILRHMPPEAIVPKHFFHVNAYKHCCRLRGNRINHLTHEHDLTEVLRRIQHDLNHPDFEYGLNADAIFLHEMDRQNGTDMYNEYTTMYMRAFEGYSLGQPLPDLEPCSEAVVSKVDEIERARLGDLLESRRNN